MYQVFVLESFLLPSKNSIKNKAISVNINDSDIDRYHVPLLEMLKR